MTETHLDNTAIAPPSQDRGGDDAVPADNIKLGRLLAFAFPAVTMMYGAQIAIGAVLLPGQIAELAPGEKVGALALTATLAAVFALVALPAGGALSDKTRSRFGRRNPWILGTGLLAAALTVVLDMAPSLMVLTGVFALSAILYNLYAGAISAVLPERVPEARRGIASAIFGLGTPIGLLIGINIAGMMSRTTAYWILAALFALATVAFVFGAREPDYSNVSKAQTPRRNLQWRSLLTAFAAFRSHDFTFAFISRAAFFLAYNLVNGYLLYLLSDFIGVENLPGQNPAMAVGILTSISTVMWLIIATIMGWLADKLNLRKVFVAIASIGLGLTMLVPAISPTWTGMLTYAVLSGGFIGTYFAVDLALMSLVLPNKETQGKDMGILTAGLTLPGLFAGALAGLIITFLGGYPALFCTAAGFAVIGGLATWRIRAVR